jgi:sulfur carrier protein
MIITVNGKAESIMPNTILEYITEKKIKPEALIVEYNFKIIKKDLWGTTFLKDNDTLELLSFVGGG